MLAQMYSNMNSYILVRMQNGKATLEGILAGSDIVNHKLHVTWQSNFLVFTQEK